MSRFSAAMPSAEAPAPSSMRAPGSGRRARPAVTRRPRIRSRRCRRAPACSQPAGAADLDDRPGRGESPCAGRPSRRARRARRGLEQAGEGVRRMGVGVGAAAVEDVAVGQVEGGAPRRGGGDRRLHPAATKSTAEPVVVVEPGRAGSQGAARRRRPRAPPGPRCPSCSPGKSAVKKGWKSATAGGRPSMPGAERLGRAVVEVDDPAEAAGRRRPSGAGASAGSSARRARSGRRQASIGAERRRRAVVEVDDPADGASFCARASAGSSARDPASQPGWLRIALSRPGVARLNRVRITWTKSVPTCIPDLPATAHPRPLPPAGGGPQAAARPARAGD